jgi:hypothetical protein
MLYFHLLSSYLYSMYEKWWDKTSKKESSEKEFVMEIIQSNPMELYVDLLHLSFKESLKFLHSCLIKIVGHILLDVLVGMKLFPFHLHL